jgi:hypothetical protein
VDVEPGGDIEANQNKVTIIFPNEDSSGSSLANKNSPAAQATNRSEALANRSKTDLADASASVGLFEALAALQDATPSKTQSTSVATTTAATADNSKAVNATTTDALAPNQTAGQEITRSTWELTQGVYVTFIVQLVLKIVDMQFQFCILISSF